MDIALQLKQFTIEAHTIELFVPDPLAVRTAYENGTIPFPYWSQVWPAAIGLTQFLLKNPEVVQDKIILELGAGLGLPSLAITPYAKKVICTDLSAEAIKVMENSVRYNKLNNFYLAQLDWKELANNFEADVVLLSDVNYTPSVFPVQQKLIERILKEKKTIFLSTPQRLMAGDFVTSIIKHCIRREEIKVQCRESIVPITVMVLSSI